MDEQLLLKSVIGAARDVFGTMIGLAVDPAPAYVEQASPAEHERVVALIGLAGSWIGTGMICCSPALACKIASIMLMNEYDSVTEDVLDTMAEMANMIYGNVKTELEAEVGHLGLSIPTVIFGRDFAARSMGTRFWNVVPIHVAGEVLNLKICLTRNRDAEQPTRVNVRPFAVVREDV